MFDKAKFENMPKFEDFNFWFLRTAADNVMYCNKSDLPDPHDLVSAYSTPISEEVQAELNRFTDRPEFIVGQSIPIESRSASNNNVDYMIDQFETLITGAIFIRYLRAGKNPDSAMGVVANFLNWIRSTDFYFCPASTRFHDAVPSGLLFHTLNVYNNMIELRKVSKFSNTPLDSIVIVSLCHDLTKIGNYESYMRNVKNEDTQQWEQVPSYRWKGNPYPFGHGVASMYIITQFFNLSVEEMLAIRWHMGEYRVATQEVGELEDASEIYPLVRMTQFADQLACVKY